MIKNYWQFIFGLQYNANLFLKNNIDYLQIRHAWSIDLHDLFLVRDFHTNTLLYDSIDGLVISLYQQQFKECSLYPFSILSLDDRLHEHSQFEFINNDEPVVVFKSFKKMLALIQIKEKLQSPTILPIGDPREFWGTTSSQEIDTRFGLFSLIELSLDQQNACLFFNQNLNYNSLPDQIITQFSNHQFTKLIYPHFKMVNNLYLNMYEKDEFPFLEQDTNNPHIGLSLIQMLYKMKNNAYALMHPKNDYSPYNDFNNQDHTLFLEYLDILHYTFTQVVCYTANHMQYNETINLSTLYLFNQNNITNDSSSASTEISNDKPMTMPRALITILLFITIVFCILYGFYWLINRFEFIKFVAIVLGGISFLYILSKR